MTTPNYEESLHCTKDNIDSFSALENATEEWALAEILLQLVLAFYHNFTIGPPHPPA